MAGKGIKTFLVLKLCTNSVIWVQHHYIERRCDCNFVLILLQVDWFVGRWLWKCLCRWIRSGPKASAPSDWQRPGTGRHRDASKRPANGTGSTGRLQAGRSIGGQSPPSCWNSTDSTLHVVWVKSCMSYSYSSSLFDEIADFLVRHRSALTISRRIWNWNHGDARRTYTAFFLTFVCGLHCVYFRVKCWPFSLEAFKVSELSKRF